MGRNICGLVRGALSAAVIAGALLGPAPLRAQSTTSPPCMSMPRLPIASQDTDACQKARDLFAFLAPQVGVAVSGGNPLPGDAGSLGGFGKVALSVRMIAVDGRLPKNSVALSPGTGAVSEFGAARTAVPIPAADLAIGFFSGFPLGLTNVGGIDLLVGATYLPSISRNAFAFEPQGGGFGASYGVRVGALQESSIVPGVSVSWQRRQLPESDLSYTPSNDTLQISSIKVRSNAVRVVISKRLALVGLAAGVGQDRIASSSSMNAIVNEQVGSTLVRQTVSLSSLRQSVIRNTSFVNASFSLLVVRIVGEIGWSSKGTLQSPVVNSFGGRQANEGYRYGSLGLTARF